MLELWNKLFSWQEFIPHGHCYLWKPGLVWLHIISDTVIGIAYYSIPVVLIYFVRKRQDLPFNGIFFLFSSFIVACGTTHLLEIWTLWHPIYWFSGLLKAITAGVSLYTAITLVLLVPKALAIPSQGQLEKVNSELQQQIRERFQIEQALQKANEELFHKNQQRLELAHKIARIGTFEWNLQTNLVIWTEELEALYGLPIGSFGGRYEHWAQVVHSDDLARVEQEIQCAIYEHKEIDTEYRIIWADGSQHWIAAKAQVFGDQTGKPLRMIGINMDISERKQAEQKIREQAALLDVTQDAIVVHSLNEDNILFWNKGAESLYGWKAQQAIGRNASILLYDDEQSLHTLNTAKETVLLKGGWYGELHQFTQDNKEIIVSSRWTLLNNWFDHTTAILSVNTDITDKKKLEAQFFRAQRLESIGTLVQLGGNK